MRDSAPRFDAAGATILGASFDTSAENLAFATAQGFDYSLLSDVDRSVGSAYDAVRGPGEQYEQYPRRVAYLIDTDGVVRASYDVSDVAGFAERVLADLERLQEGTAT